MTSSRSSQNGRSLGNARLVNKSRLLPPLAKSLNDSSKSQENRLMVHGDGLTTPPKASSDKDDAVFARLSTPTTRPLTSKSDPSSKIEMKEPTRDKQQNRIQSLQKVVDQLRAELKTKEEELDNLQARLLQIEEHYKHLYEEERQAHSATRDELDALRKQLEESRIYTEQLKAQHERKILDLSAEHEQRLSTLRAEKDKEIADRDAKIEKLKKQMATVLKKNSWERQQQLEELAKELSTISEEASALRLKCKNIASNSKSCDNCNAMKVELERKTKKLSEKELLVQQLNSVCKKFETQLKQQDLLLKEFAVGKGFKTNYDPGK